MAKRIWDQKWLWTLVHIMSWAILFSLPYLLRLDRSANDPQVYERHKTAFLVLFVIVHLFWMILFYLNAFVFIPRFMYRRKPGLYVASILGFVAIILLADLAYFKLFIPGAKFKVYNYFAFNFFPLLFVMLASTAYRLIIDRIEERQREKDRINENLKTELSLLRSQVSPHFMFNVLNNMVALARKKSDLLEPSLIKLSQLLRYMLYETHEKVALQREVEYLQSYIDLQQQRFGKAVEVRANFELDAEHHSIEPMLLIPFVENAFKHGAVMVQDPVIDISLKTTGNRLDFIVRNKFRTEGEEVKDAASGIGLVNVERRLDLLYPKQHKLEITRKEPWFDVHLHIDLI